MGHEYSSSVLIMDSPFNAPVLCSADSWGQDILNTMQSFNKSLKALKVKLRVSFCLYVFFFFFYHRYKINIISQQINLLDIIITFNDDKLIQCLSARKKSFPHSPVFSYSPFPPCRQVIT